MKISETKVETKQFEPITLNITFESKKELEYFYGMVNCADYYITKNANQDHRINASEWDLGDLELFSTDLFDWVDCKLDEQP